MSTFLIPEVNQRWFTNTGQPLAGGQLFFYQAGSTTKQNTYTDPTGVTANTNPVILDSGGMPPNMIWGIAGQKYKVVVLDVNNVPVGIVLDNLQNIDDVATASFSEWQSGPTPTFLSSTTFSVAGNQTGLFSSGRRIQAAVSAGTVYGSVLQTSFSGNTTVTVVMDPGQNLDSGLTSVNYGLLQYPNPSTPAPNPVGGGVASAATLNLETNYGESLTGTTTITAVTLAQGKSRTLTVTNTGLTIQPGGNLATQTGRPLVLVAGDRVTFSALASNVYVSVIRSLYPNFSVAGNASVSANVSGKFTSLTTKQFDDGSCFDSVTNFRYQPTVPGRYQINIASQIAWQSGTGSFTSAYCQLAKNGSVYIGGNDTIIAGDIRTINSTSQPGNGTSVVVDMNGTTDYLEVDYNVGGLSGTITITFGVVFSGAKIDP